MKTLIAYSTKYGCTERCGKKLAEKLNGEVELKNVKKEKNIDLSKYDKVIIGGSIYMGKIQKEISEFSIKNLDVLKGKKIGLFICCMRDGEIAATEIKDAFPEELISNSIAKECFGGEFILSKMNFMDRMIVKKVSKIDKDTSNISEENIDSFAKLMNRE